MEDHAAATFTTSLELFFRSWPTVEVDDKLVLHWWMNLCDYPMSDVTRAFDRISQTDANPSLSRVLSHVRAYENDRSVVKWPPSKAPVPAMSSRPPCAEPVRTAEVVCRIQESIQKLQSGGMTEQEASIAAFWRDTSKSARQRTIRTVPTVSAQWARKSTNPLMSERQRKPSPSAVARPDPVCQDRRAGGPGCWD
jgi:hypothetical protein